jgi:hypothetical protein
VEGRRGVIYERINVSLKKFCVNNKHRPRWNVGCIRIMYKGDMWMQLYCICNCEFGESLLWQVC